MLVEILVILLSYLINLILYEHLYFLVIQHIHSQHISLKCWFISTPKTSRWCCRKSVTLVKISLSSKTVFQLLGAIILPLCTVCILFTTCMFNTHTVYACADCVNLGRCVLEHYITMKPVTEVHPPPPHSDTYRDTYQSSEDLRLTTQLLPSVPHTDKSLWSACSSV